MDSWCHSNRVFRKSRLGLEIYRLNHSDSHDLGSTLSEATLSFTDQDLSGLGLSLENLITDGRLFTQTSFKTASRGKISRYEVNLGIFFYPLLACLSEK